MGNTEINRDNFIVIQGWMISELNLKGNELVIYACIYGFSQMENQVFSGGLQYLANWTNSTKQGVVKNLKSLVDKGYIQKEDKYINGVKFCSYYATKFNTPLNKVDGGMQQSLTGGMQQSLTNNISLNNKDIIKNNINNVELEKPYTENPNTVNVDSIVSDESKVKFIVGYLNEKANTKFRYVSKDTKKHIHARLSEGFTIDDFKTVIDKKCADWRGTEWEQYLRPTTLFGTKFEAYLNAPITKRKTYGATGVEIKQEQDDDLAGIL